MSTRRGGQICQKEQVGRVTNTHMMIVMFHFSAAYRVRLTKWLEESCHHAVLHASGGPGNWMEALARYEPDLVLLPRPAQTHISALHFGAADCPDCHFWFLPEVGSEAYLDFAVLCPFMEEAEQRYAVRQYLARPYASNKRIILLDLEYEALASGKLNVPTTETGWQQVASGQETRFLAQLATAGISGRHARAMLYLRAPRRANR